MCQDFYDYNDNPYFISDGDVDVYDQDGEEIGYVEGGLCL